MWLTCTAVLIWKCYRMLGGNGREEVQAGVDIGRCGSK